MARIPFFRTHERYREMADAYLDGELRPGDLAKFEAHSAGCAECAAMLETGRMLKQSLATVPMVDAPRSFRLTPAMIEANAPARPKAAPTSPLLVVARFGAAASVAAFGVVGTLQLTSNSGGNDPTTAAAPVYELSTQAGSENVAGGEGGAGANDDGDNGTLAGSATESPQIAPPPSADITGAGVDGDMSATPPAPDDTVADPSPESNESPAGDASRLGNGEGYDAAGDSNGGPEATAIRALADDEEGNDYGRWLVVLGGATIVSVAALGTLEYRRRQV